MSFNKLISILTIACLFNLGARAEEKTSADVKSDSLKFLQDLRNQSSKRLGEIDQNIAKKFEETGSKDLEHDVQILKAAKQEQSLRQEFLNRLIFQIDKNFHGGDLRAFLEKALPDMAKVDAIQSTADTGLWKFLKYAADAVHRLPEQKENILSFLEGYMNRSVSNPIRPDEYLSSRNYTNGADSEAGRPMNREDVGEIADRRLKQLDQAQPAAHDKNRQPQLIQQF